MWLFWLLVGSSLGKSRELTDQEAQVMGKGCLSAFVSIVIIAVALHFMSYETLLSLAMNCFQIWVGLGIAFIVITIALALFK